MKLWLDDRRPAPKGWEWCKTTSQAIALLSSGRVERASLDHDLDPSSSKGGPALIPTGYDLVVWMTITGMWPKYKPSVHSANPWGARRMRALIDKHWRRL